MDQPRWDCSARATVCDAADLLDLAGLTALADRLRDDDFGGDVRAVADEVTKLREATQRSRMRVIGRLYPPAFVETAQRDRDEDADWNSKVQL